MTSEGFLETDCHNREPGINNKVGWGRMREKQMNQSKKQTKVIGSVNHFGALGMVSASAFM